MHIDTYVEALREDLASVAAVGDEATARAAELLSVALESAFARRFQEALAGAALDLSAQLDDGRVDVRVAGGDPELVYVSSEAPAPVDADETLSARITLRLPESLKARLEAAAAADGVSLNTWLVRTLGRALGSRPSTAAGRYRLTGYGRS
jgi:predicted HicB family RNase H-like nuclease